MRCDLHVHTNRSGMCTVPILSRVCRESYNEPLAVYETLKRRGMDLVTITDHDSIDGAESLRRFPDFFLSEEVSCVTPMGTRLHVGVYDINEDDHIELQKRSGDFWSLMAYLRERQLFFSVNHVFSSLTGRREHADWVLFENCFPAVETLNGQMPPFCNNPAAELAARLGKAAVGGSDAHTLAPLGLTYTEVPGAHSRQAFLEGLRESRGCVQGRSGSLWNLTRTVWEIGLGFMCEKPWAMLLFPLMFVAPTFTAAQVLRDVQFARKWGPSYGAGADLRLREPGVSVPEIAI